MSKFKNSVVRRLQNDPSQKDANTKSILQPDIISERTNERMKDDNKKASQQQHQHQQLIKHFRSKHPIGV